MEEEERRRTDGFAADDLAEYDVLIIEMGRGSASDEELRAVGVCACVGLRAVR
jgi:hypothetical protein